MLNQIEKLASILNAKIISINPENNQVNVEESTIKNDLNKIKRLISKINLHSEQVYQAYFYDTGYFLCIHIENQTTILFWFDYTDTVSNYNELMLINTLTNIDSIAKIIYSLYTLKSPSNQNLVLYNLEDNQDTIVLTQNINFDLLFHTETRIIRSIIYSRKDDLLDALNQFSQVGPLNSEQPLNSSIRNEKNYLISYISILNRAIIQWGYPCILAYKIHSELLIQIDTTKTIPNIFEVIKSISWYYFRIIQEYRIKVFLPLHQRIKSYIDEHIGENITLNDIASSLHASKKTLNPAFKKQFHITIMKFVKQRKIDTAKELLISSSMNIPEISILLSFSTPSYFIKTFKDVTGMTPNYYRKHFFDQHLRL